MIKTNMPTIQRELGEYDAEIGIYQEQDGSICFTMTQLPNADTNSTAAQIAKALILVATDTEPYGFTTRHKDNILH